MSADATDHSPRCHMIAGRTFVILWSSARCAVKQQTVFAGAICSIYYKGFCAKRVRSLQRVMVKLAQNTRSVNCSWSLLNVHVGGLGAEVQLARVFVYMLAGQPS